MVSIGGINSQSCLNDVWVSTGSSADIGTKWAKLQTAPWQARGGAYVNMTSNGILIVSGGFNQREEDQKMTIMNDIWASLDGGYSWGVCATDAEYSDRAYTYTAMDGDGYLWMAGGFCVTAGRLLSDVWQTTASSLLFRMLQMHVVCWYRCGAGLKCLPDSPGFKSGMWGVICDACPKLPE